MLGNLGENLTNTMKKLAGMAVIDKKTIKEVVKDIQRALIQSDVNIQLVLKLSKTIEDRALNEKPPKGITPREHVITIVYEEMVNLLGEKSHELNIDDKPFKIMFLGLQGSGKTTTIGKLARFLQKKGYSPAIVSTDTWRPAAYEQLRQLTEELNISLYGDPNNKDALDLAEKGLKKFKNQKIIIFDTAGRHKDEADLLEEMENLSSIIDPNEAILVIDGTIGQQAHDQANAFAKTTDIGSIIVTKLDGSAKGGGALSAVAEVGAPIKFIGTGERLDDFEVFDPERFISRLLGMGDIKTLIEKAEEVIDEDVAAETMNAMLSGKFTIKDMKNQFDMMGKMGPVQQVMNMVPGIGAKIPKEARKMTEGKIDKYKIIMSSMSIYEMENPKVIKKSRITRIARGAGVRNEEVKELLKYFNSTKKAMKGIGKRGGGGGINRLVSQFMK
ncbi:signal recognition particle protein Srp54 [Methanobrevibacter filiformis]|uniref:Signal recognition particle 54 kDa protein n=1 Tax=Methanobrevibacter filiformis TaxID=55758 RepID=A0A165ZZX8_9EURY|nr:signal recognition particle protein Srp54 [Methanobrevibacter filiformis]KZX11389.1 signal recognition particle protein [Methanobrevibacter filiformis]